jgi:hypothetical protein
MGKIALEKTDPLDITIQVDISTLLFPTGKTVEVRERAIDALKETPATFETTRALLHAARNEDTRAKALPIVVARLYQGKMDVRLARLVLGEYIGFPVKIRKRAIVALAGTGSIEDLLALVETYGKDDALRGMVAKQFFVAVMSFVETAEIDDLKRLLTAVKDAILVMDAKAVSQGKYLFDIFEWALLHRGQAQAHIEALLRALYENASDQQIAPKEVLKLAARRGIRLY